MGPFQSFSSSLLLSIKLIFQLPHLHVVKRRQNSSQISQASLMDSCVRHFRVNSIASSYGLQKCLLLGLRNHILFARLLNSGFAQMRTRCLLWAGAAPGAHSLAIGSGFAKDVPSSRAPQPLQREKSCHFPGNCRWAFYILPSALRSPFFIQ